jgi:acyl dehydratase
MNELMNNLKEGQEFTEVVVDNLTRTQIVQYAGASGDFNPLHTDEPFATEIAGYPSTFAHGMLGMALTGKLLTKLFDNISIKKFGVRFQNIIWPGDTLTTQIVIDKIDKNAKLSLIELSIKTFNQEDKIVLSGSASIEDQN